MIPRLATFVCFAIHSCQCFKYLGCFEEESLTNRLMKGHQELGQADLTVEKCMETCSSKKFRFAGLQSRDECFCSNDPPPYEKVTSITECVSKCTGNEYQHCGGNYRLSIYDLKETHDQKYLGCYLEINQIPPNPIFKGHVEKHFSGLSITKCVNICKRRRFKYAGLKNGAECHCSHENPSLSRIAPDIDCSSKCSGSNEKCGAPSRYSVYDSKEPHPMKHLGCYREKLKREKLIDDAPTEVSALTVSKCRELCTLDGVRYFGLQKGSECVCFNRIPPPTFSAPLEQCNQKCSGNLKEVCGSNQRLNIYDMKVYRSFSYLGCYTDPSDTKRLMPEIQRFFIGSLTPDNCVQFCKEIYRFKFAGTKKGNECYCSNEMPYYQLSAPYNHCATPCDGDNNERCGGPSHLSVYRFIDTPDTSESNYIGCYKKRDVAMNKGLIMSHTLSQDNCVGHCFLKGYAYAGISDGTKCSCGDSYHGLELFDDSECEIACPGNPMAICGGEGYFGIFETLIPNESESGKKVGCYREDTDTNVLNGEQFSMPETNSPKRCVNLCKLKNFKYAGVQIGGLCTCGNDLPPNTNKTDNNKCETPCPGDKDMFCGGLKKVLIYTTSPGHSVPDTTPTDGPIHTKTCDLSKTIVNGKPACQGAVVFQDSFGSNYNENLWTREVFIPNEPDEDFVVYTHLNENIMVRNGILQIIPTILDDTTVRGNLALDRCTKSDIGEHFCKRNAVSFFINPPIKSGQLTTREHFSFKYGRINIKARLPQGDWLYPEISLIPKGRFYGPHLMSGRMVVAVSRGNKGLKSNLDEIGNQLLQSGILMGPKDAVKEKFIQKKKSDGWSTNFHDFQLIWTPENITFSVDNEKEELIVNSKTSLGESMHFNEIHKEEWSKGTYLAPFDQEFYLLLGLSAGGPRWFPDNSLTGSQGHTKPWRNAEVKAMAKFYRDIDNWKSTWNEMTAMEIDEVTITAL